MFTSDLFQSDDAGNVAVVGDITDLGDFRASAAPM